MIVVFFEKFLGMVEKTHHDILIQILYFFLIYALDSLLEELKQAGKEKIFVFFFQIRLHCTHNLEDLVHHADGNFILLVQVLEKVSYGLNSTDLSEIVNESRNYLFSYFIVLLLFRYLQCFILHSTR